MILNNDPKVNHSRPAIDPLFYSVALNNGPNTIGVILSGFLDDGSAGLLVIKKCGGIPILQDLEESEYPDMPKNASKYVHADFFICSNKISSALISLTDKARIGSHENTPEDKVLNSEAEMFINNNEHSLKEISTPASYSCPSCKGILWKIDDRELDRYRCSLGHAYSLKSLEATYALTAEDAMWAVLKALEDKGKLAKNIAKKAEKENAEDKDYLTKKANNITEQVKAIKTLLEFRGAS
ncbi:fused chemotaxis regulator; protein-glutamat [Legionella sainthelensi]|uniref:chemotaxis protein CheB n=1 Tax=Legionella sainthelensi TaxID=28087 RepID=UPI000F6D9C54|nr:chemotaxis protein CheB [Legionella sainthelensi]VEB36712.1 fused chemotaxis regulator; protein-glutamat [Legionella sainthelensi]